MVIETQDMDKISDTVKLLRLLEERGWPARRIAQAINVSEPTVSRWKSDPSREPRFAWMVEGALGKLIDQTPPPKQKPGPKPH
jgi:transcriptional regulator with XRE-family HTH domain